MDTTTKVSKPVADLANLLGELHGVLERHGATGFCLMFAPQQLELPDGHVLVQRLNPETNAVELVPTPIDVCALGDVLHDTQVFDLADCEYITLASMQRRPHTCILGHGLHTHEPMPPSPGPKPYG